MSQTLESRASEPPQWAADALLDELDPPSGAHALVIGQHTLETLCGLIRRGCAGGTERRPDEQAGPRPEPAEIAVLPDPASVTETAVSVAVARRALAAGGRIAICDARGLHRGALAALLHTQGFQGIRTHHTPAGLLVLGELPGRPARA